MTYKITGRGLRSIGRTSQEQLLTQKTTVFTMIRKLWLSLQKLTKPKSLYFIYQQNRTPFTLLLSLLSSIFILGAKESRKSLALSSTNTPVFTASNSQQSALSASIHTTKPEASSCLPQATTPSTQQNTHTHTPLRLPINLKVKATKSGLYPPPASSCTTLPFTLCAGHNGLFVPFTHFPRICHRTSAHAVLDGTFCLPPFTQLIIILPRGYQFRHIFLREAFLFIQAPITPRTSPR